MNFQSFETAPRDGQEILVIDRYGRFHVTHFCKNRERFILHGMASHDSAFRKWVQLPKIGEQL